MIEISIEKIILKAKAFSWNGNNYETYDVEIYFEINDLYLAHKIKKEILELSTPSYSMSIFGYFKDLENVRKILEKYNKDKIFLKNGGIFTNSGVFTDSGVSTDIKIIHEIKYEKELEEK